VAAVTGPVSDADGAADVAGGGVVLEVLELIVELLHNRGLLLGVAVSADDGMDKGDNGVGGMS